jgi:hypothetical protein
MLRDPRQLNGPDLFPFFECISVDTFAHVWLTVEYFLKVLRHLRRQSGRLFEPDVKVPALDLGLNELAMLPLLGCREPCPIFLDIL